MVVVVRTEMAADLQRRLASHDDVAVFGEGAAFHALRAILTRLPTLIALDPMFAATSRGATLIARVKADPSLASADIRLLLIDRVEQFLRLLEVSGETAGAAVIAVSRELEWCGTRLAPRFEIGEAARATLNGEPSRLIDLSTSGVQLVTPGRLRPSQGFRLTLVDEKRKTRLHAVVAWAILEGTTAAPSYRAGARFIDSDYEAIDAYCRRYGSGKNQLFVVPPAEIVAPDRALSSPSAAGSSQLPRSA